MFKVNNRNTGARCEIVLESFLENYNFNFYARSGLLKT